jgi:hypothetical protein
MRWGFTTRRFISFDTGKGHPGKIGVNLLTRERELRYRYSAARRLA